MPRLPGRERPAKGTALTSPTPPGGNDAPPDWVETGLNGADEGELIWIRAKVGGRTKWARWVRVGDDEVSLPNNLRVMRRSR